MTATARKQHHNIQRRARAGVKGLIIAWEDKEPLRDTTAAIAGRVTHRNPIYRLTARRIFRDFGDWITERAPFRWLIKIDVVFDYPNGRRQFETRELEAVTTIANLNEHCLAQIQDAIKHGNAKHYTHTAFTIECLGSH